MGETQLPVSTRVTSRPRWPIAGGLVGLALVIAAAVLTIDVSSAHPGVRRTTATVTGYVASGRIGAVTATYRDDAGVRHDAVVGELPPPLPQVGSRLSVDLRAPTPRGYPAYATRHRPRAVTAGTWAGLALLYSAGLAALTAALGHRLRDHRRHGRIEAQ